MDMQAELADLKELFEKKMKSIETKHTKLENMINQKDESSR